jgi:rubrerythrin
VPGASGLTTLMSRDARGSRIELGSALARIGVARFNIEEILQLALSLERVGEDFYRRAEEKLEDPRLRETFRFLALEEVGHARTFGAMLDRIGRFDPGPEATEEYQAYLRAYVDNAVFSRDRAEELLSGRLDQESALRFAMQREQDSIHFYLELRGLLPEQERGAIEEILDEERAHYKKLSELLGETRASARPQK